MVKGISGDMVRFNHLNSPNPIEKAGTSMPKAVGIDLGTTNSVVSVLEGGDPVVIPNALIQVMSSSANDEDNTSAKPWCGLVGQPKLTGNVALATAPLVLVAVTVTENTPPKPVGRSKLRFAGGTLAKVQVAPPALAEPDESTVPAGKPERTTEAGAPLPVSTNGSAIGNDATPLMASSGVAVATSSRPSLPAESLEPIPETEVAADVSAAVAVALLS